MEEVSYRLFRMADVTDVASLSQFLLGFLALTAGALLLKWWAAKECRHRAKRLVDLYVPVEYRPNSGESCSGFLRSLDLNYATIVTSDEGLNRGAFLDVDLGKVPDKKEESHFIKGRVLRRRSLGGLPEAWLIDIKLLECFPERIAQVREKLNQ